MPDVIEQHAPNIGQWATDLALRQWLGHVEDSAAGLYRFVELRHASTALRDGEPCGGVPGGVGLIWSTDPREVTSFGDDGRPLLAGVAVVSPGQQAATPSAVSRFGWVRIGRAGERIRLQGSEGMARGQPVDWSQPQQIGRLDGREPHPPVDVPANKQTASQKWQRIAPCVADGAGYVRFL